MRPVVVPLSSVDPPTPTKTPGEFSQIHLPQPRKRSQSVAVGESPMALTSESAVRDCRLFLRKRTPFFGEKGDKVSAIARKPRDTSRSPPSPAARAATDKRHLPGMVVRGLSSLTGLGTPLHTECASRTSVPLTPAPSPPQSVLLSDQTSLRGRGLG